MPKYELGGIFDPTKANPNDAHSILMRLIPEASRVLEFGCATGYLSGYMAQTLGCQVIGLEYDSEAVAVARSRGVNAFEADLDKEDVLDLARPYGP